MIGVLTRKKELPATFKISKDSESCRVWNFSLPGAKGSPWEGYQITGKLLFAPAYPKGSVSIFFKPAIYHPNVDPMDGLVCDTGMKSAGLEKIRECTNLVNFSADEPTLTHENAESF